jgi:pyruvate dehydrogenase E2 component (dihydrolipoamide acetyltransferase)
MPVEFKLPDLGENVASADVISVLVNVGDTIKKEQPVIEAETEKAVMEIPSTVEGKVTELKVKKGDKVKPGQLILVVDAAGAAAAPAAKAAAPAAAKPAAAAPLRGASVAASSAPAPAASGVAGGAAAPVATASAAVPFTNSPTSGGDRLPVPAAPSVRQFAREIGVDIQQVPGTGPGGRISIDDVKAFARTRPAAPGSGAAGANGSAKPVEREPWSKIRKVTAAQMSKSWSQVVLVTEHAKADVTDLETLRQKFKEKAEKAGGKLTVTAMLVKTVASALKVFPKLNASIDTEKEETVLKKYYNIGVAVDTPRGLVVPVIKDADKKSMVQIAVELSQLSAKARDGKLVPDDMSGGTFSISNLGGLGIGHFTPIVNVPEVAILGVGLAENEPVWQKDKFVPRLRMPLSLSFDHRLIDGAEAARFLKWIIEAVEQPLLISLEG